MGKIAIRTQNRLSKPYCQFNPAEWEDETGISCYSHIKEKVANGSNLCYHDITPHNQCHIHRDISLISAEGATNALLGHFDEAIDSTELKRAYNTVVGVEVPGLKLDGQTIPINTKDEVSILHLLSHEPVRLSGAETLSRLRIRGSLFLDDFVAYEGSFARQVELDNSQFEADAVFQKARFEAGASFYQCSFHHELNLAEVQVNGNIDLRGIDADEDILLNNATIDGDLNLRESNVDGDVLLAGTTIEGNLLLGDATIREELDLRFATIKGKVIAQEAVTNSLNLEATHVIGPWVSRFHEIGTARVVATHLMSSFLLEECRILESFEANQVSVEEGFRWRKTKSDGNIILENCQFNHIVDFTGGQIEGELSLQQSDMGHHLRILSTEIDKALELNATELGSYTVIGDGSSVGALITNTANATGVVRINDIDITGETECKDLAIDEHLEFSECEFIDSVSLDKSVVDEYVDIQNCSFRSELSIQNCDIGRNLQIINSDCEAPVELRLAQIGTLFVNSGTTLHSLDLAGTQVTERVALLDGVLIYGELNLSDTMLSDGISFDNANVGKLVLDEADIDGQLSGQNLTVAPTPQCSPSNINGNLSANNTRIMDEATLERAMVKGEADFGEAVFSAVANFDQFRVAGQFGLSGAEFQGLFRAVGLSANSINLTGSYFAGSALVHDCRIRGDIDGSQIHLTGSNLTLTRTPIDGVVSFNNADLEGDLVITECQIRGREANNGLISHEELSLPAEAMKPTLIFEESSINGDFILENSYLAGSVTGIASNFRTVSIIGRTVEGDYRLDDAEITETLKIKSINIFGELSASDIRLGSKCNVLHVSASVINFADSLFKWNVSISKCLAGDVSVENATFRNRLDIEDVSAYNSPVQLNDARIAHATIEWGRGTTDINCQGAELGNLDTELPDNDLLWNRLKINRTRFDEFEFADFTKSLNQTNHLIQQADKRGWFSRAANFLPTVSSHLRDYYRGKSMEELIRIYDNREVTYRRAKDSADTTGDNPAAAKFYMHEKKYRRRRRFWEGLTGNENRARNLLGWGVNLGLGIIAGHGERTMQTLFTAAVLLLSVGVFLMTPFATPPSTPALQPLSALEVSSRAFVGARQIPAYEMLNGFTQGLLIIERGLAIAFVPLLVFTLTRSLHR